MLTGKLFYRCAATGFAVLLSCSSLYAASPKVRGMNVNLALTSADIAELCTWGANVVRYQIASTTLDGSSVADYNAFISAALDDLDTKLDALSDCGIKVYIDLHTPPGGINFSHAKKPHYVFQDAAYQAAFLATWKTIAQRYNGDTRVYGYLPASEPRTLDSPPAGVLGWSALSKQVTKIIRAADKKHVINIMAPYGNQANFVKISKIKGYAKIVYGFDYYYPTSYTYQGIGGLPTGVPLPSNLKVQLTKRMTGALKFARKNKVKMEVLEFSAVRYAPDVATYYTTLINILEKRGYNWFYHAFREASVWDVELGTDINNTTRLESAPGETLLKSYFDKN